ncbi:MAG: hypothetical protein WCS37_05445, partial [Chloroflexota bacterium]
PPPAAKGKEPVPPTKAKEVLEPFGFDFSGTPPPTAKVDDAAKAFSFDFSGTPPARLDEPAQPFNFDFGENLNVANPIPETLGFAQKQPEPTFNFDFGLTPPTTSTRETDFDFDFKAETVTPETQTFQLDDFQQGLKPVSEAAGSGSTPTLPDFDFGELAGTSPSPENQGFGPKKNLTDFGAVPNISENSQTISSPFGFDLSELTRPSALVPEPKVSKEPPRGIETPPTPVRHVPEARFVPEPTPPPSFKKETLEIPPVVEARRRPTPPVSPPRSEATSPEVAASTSELAPYLNRVRQNPRDLEANLYLGNIYLEQNKYNESIAHYTNAIKVADTGTLKEIVTRIEKIIAAGVSNPRFHRVLGDAYMKQGQYHWALSEYSKALGPTVAKR